MKNKRAQLWQGRLIRFSRLVWNRFLNDRCWRMAAGLSYTSLLAVVPLSAIAFSMLTAFPVFEGVRERIQSTVFTNFLPSSAEAMSGYLDQFISNTTSLSAIGIVALGATAILLLGTIEADLNVIFRVRRPRPLIPRLLVFWTMITLGPLLLGVSFSLTTYLFIATQWMGVDIAGGPIGILGRFVPTALIIVGLSVFFMAIPNRHVSFKAALMGAVISGLLFTTLRMIFGWYVATFPTYQNVYGTLSVVPIFLIWMYLSWSVVLLGAVITRSAGDFKGRELRFTMGDMHDNERVVTAMALINTLFQTSKTEVLLNETKLVAQSKCDHELGEIELEVLINKGLISLNTDSKCILSRDLSHMSLHDLYQAMDMTLPQSAAQDEDASNSSGWRGSLEQTMKKARSDSEHALSVSLRDILDASQEEI
ncbi:MAG: YihY family inner membrane protein [Rhodospirillales bacterium]|jgi:membrane protein|nr:YihY family inner membrane protein [Rhodospirillales bacterium]